MRGRLAAIEKPVTPSRADVRACPRSPVISPRLRPGYDVVLCDVWGVVHNGVAATPEACDALARFRAAGGTVVLITNAPRPGEVWCSTMLDRPQGAARRYDGIVSSGDVTRALIAARGGRARLPYRAASATCRSSTASTRRVAPIESADYVGLLRPVRRHRRDARRITATSSQRMRARTPDR